MRFVEKNQIEAGNRTRKLTSLRMQKARTRNLESAEKGTDDRALNRVERLPRSIEASAHGLPHLRIQSVILHKPLFKLAPSFRGVFLHTASFEAEWRVLCYELPPVVIPDGKYDVSPSGNQVFAFTGRRSIVGPKKGGRYLRSRQAARNQAP
jgi:hypothetical protein